jgi:hypothetical protein
LQRCLAAKLLPIAFPPDTPASVIEYFQKFNKPLPEQFCAKEDAAPQASEEPSQGLRRQGHQS